MFIQSRSQAPAENPTQKFFCKTSTGKTSTASVQPFLTDQYNDIPWFADVGDDRYNPTPMCYVEELVGEVLGENLNDIINTFDAASLPIVRFVESSINDAGGPGTFAAIHLELNPEILHFKSIPNLPSIPAFGGLALGGAGFDIGSALGFISAISGIFSCDLSLIVSK